ncbi:hypothetical protein FHL15_008159 [Xylaria flabelliformis]|uniref:Uncharacterized protein n=1 Tax=Xylaria flabelliformis TaxID=2512241 RepID=A0A553HSP7_9PEZI|nr:hypothetical protein FHL15_008159 [Xylaria flabelliformis]
MSPRASLGVHENINLFQINNESSSGVQLLFDFKNTFANLGARLSGPGRATVINQTGLTSMQPSDVASDPLSPEFNLPALWSPLHSNFHETTFVNLWPRILNPGGAALPDQFVAGSSATLGPVDYSLLRGGVPSLNYSHTFDASVQLALVSPQETVPNDQNRFSLNFRPQGDDSELQAGLPTPSGIKIPICSTISFSSHFTGFEEFLYVKDVSFTRPSLTRLRSWPPIYGGLTSRFIAEVVLSKQQYLTRRASGLEETFDRLETLIPRESTTLTTKDQALEMKFTRILLFSMLNGFAGLNDIPVDNMLKFLGRLSIFNRSFLTALKECSTPAAKTFRDTMFRASIEAKDEHALKLLLEHSSVDVNATVCYSRSNTFTPIERAASLQAYGLVAILLQYGADVNKTWVKKCRGGALTQLMQGLSTDMDRAHKTKVSSTSITVTSDMIETVELLVRAGTRVTMQHLLEAGQLFNTYDVACCLSLAILPSDHQAFFAGNRHSHILDTARYSDDTLVSQIIRNMIDLCEKACCGRCLATFAENVEYAAIEAAKQGHLKVVQLLIQYVSSPTRIFCAAIRSRRKDLIHFVLSFSPDLNPSAQYLDYHENYRRTTPLAEAVKVGNRELIKYLTWKHSTGAFSHLNKGNRLRPLIFAAARWGNISFMQKLLSHSNSSSNPYRAPSLVIDIALRNGHEEMAWLLLGNGAQVQDDMLANSGGSPLSIALKSRNKPLVQAILNAEIRGIRAEDFDKALKWDDMSIVMDLMSACPGGFMTSRTLGNICQRCMQDDNMDFFRNFVESISLSQWSISAQDECLEHAVRIGHSKMVCYLLDIGANPFTNEVLEAALPASKGMLQLLFDKSRPRREIPKCIGTRLLSSVINESLDKPQALDALLETRAVRLMAVERLGRRADEEGLERGAITPLGLALVSLLKTPDKDPWMVRALLGAGSDSNRVARSFLYGKNYTGLMIALETTRRGIVQLLIDSGADVNLRPHFAVKRTPLQYAAELGHLDMVRMLLEQGAEVNAEPAIWSGGSALQLAAISGNCNIANELLDNGALLDALPSKVEGRWPLEGAAEHGRLDMIQFLWTAAIVKGGSDVVAGFQRRHCLRAMSFARKNGHMGCMDSISYLSDIPVDRLDKDDYGAPWLAYSDLSHSSSANDEDMPFLADSDGWFDHDNDTDETDSDGWHRPDDDTDETDSDSESEYR